MQFFRSLSLGNKLLVIILPFILVCFALLGMLATHKAKDALREETVRQLQGTVTSLSQMVSIAHESTVRDVDVKMAGLLQHYRGSFSLDTSRTVRMGDLDTPLLRLDGAQVNDSYRHVDDFSAQNTGSVATVFVRSGSDFIRIATSLKKEDGARAVGTPLGSSHPAYEPLMRGEAYHGKAKLFGHYYMTKYLPIRDAGNVVVGALFVGNNIDAVVEKLTKTFSSIKVGDSGYVYVLDSGGTKSRGEFAIHPDSKNIGKNVLDFKDTQGKPFFREMLDARTGYLTYWWKNSGESAEREKFAIFATAAEWDWLIACSGYTSELYAAAGSIQRYILGASLLCGVILGILIMGAIRKFLAPLKETAVIIERIAEGDLTVHPPQGGRDEIGEMQNACRRMVARLNEIMRKTAENAGQVSAAADQLRVTSEQMATGTEEVAAQTGAVATASEEMSATSTDIARSCSNAADAADRSNDSACNGARVVQETILGMNSIAEQVRETSRSIGALGARSEQIGHIVGTIEDIADQTNLLALNAAIEAARAGEQGRGFAVVADEVRALAERTTRATKEIGEMIVEIQNETRKAVSAMESGVQEAEKGAASALKSGEALEEILSRINEVSMQVSQIATAAEQQTATTSEVATNILQITEVVQQSARGAQESAGAAQQLAGLADELQGIVGQFRLAV
ncbi:methyl-accepting chemotaxis protein [Geobacter sp. DSM 9736]|uniref:methyl-accepting chemotaxis protein n=1 Tax=Geobacter sp. DSM 9736 TaxID=1277350 RepID=UPI000B5E22B8|nr:methyl-accepting chemotaxis protein [Geobacter sp. DSM 9736]SNB46526.1 Methyl-accepting chemotaxis protein [Geobacter sp. DSM 9736]